MFLELALFPPLVRFFLTFFEILIVAGSIALVLNWMSKGDE